nr:peptidoglycan recognition family protein [Sellimonas intestinalis]
MADQPEASNATYFSTGYRGASAHYFVGYSGEVWQSVSDSLAAWSVGGNKYPGTKGGSVYGKCTNYNSINIEMCVSTVKLVQGLMKKYNVPLSRVVRHYDVVGKYCPNPFVLNDDPVTWSSFKSMVAGDKDLPPDTGSSSMICVRIRNQCPVSGICEWAMVAVGDKL